MSGVCGRFLDPRRLISRLPEGNAAAIHVSGLFRSLGDLGAVDGIDLAVQGGELFSLLGPNGAGKTTTIKLLCCLLRPTADNRRGSCGSQGGCTTARGRWGEPTGRVDRVTV